jgi:hypothetical protein
MGNNSEPPVLDVEGIITTSNTIAAAAIPKKIVADPVAPSGYIFAPEEDQTTILQQIAKKEDDKQGSITKRIEASQSAAKKKAWPSLSLKDILG